MRFGVVKLTAKFARPVGVHEIGQSDASIWGVNCGCDFLESVRHEFCHGMSGALKGQKLHLCMNVRV